MEGNRKGDLAEILAIAWLWDQGYEVFRNVSCVGPIDLVVYIEGKTKLVDVKSVKKDENEEYVFNYYCLSEKQREMGVRPIWVDPINRIVGWNRDYFEES